VLDERGMALRSRPLRSLRVALAIALATSGAAASTAPSRSVAPPGLVIAETLACRVALVAISYDDPGADDAEFIELRVDGANDGGALVRTSDAGGAFHVDTADGGGDSGSGAGDGSLDAARGPTLGDCGLGELALVDGASGACNPYRTIPLANVPVPADGYVVLCPAGSSVDETAHCGVTTAGRSALRAGWLQNGPDDGLRFVATSGATADVGYEGAPACFASNATELAPEVGQLDGDAEVDDVNVFCDGRFVLLPADTVPLRSAVACPMPVDGLAGELDAGRPDSAPSDAALDGEAADAAWVPEHAPALAARGAAPAYGPLYVDAGPAGASKAAASLPRPPGCGVARSQLGVTASFGGVSAVSLLLVLVTSLRRTTPRRGRSSRLTLPTLPTRPSSAARASLPARARCGVRSGSVRRRSP
jgi:hypothetical protein